MNDPARVRTSSRALRLTAAFFFSAAAMVFFFAPARANCHIATWDSDRVDVEEDIGEVVLPMELDGSGPVTCTGSIKWETRDQSATSPADYEGKSGEVTWRVGSPRRQTVRIKIVNDTADEGGGQTFNVTMTGGTGGISPEEPGPGEGGPTVRVFIADDDEASASTPPAPTTPPATATTSATPTATTSQPVAQPTAAGSGGNAGLVAGIAAGVLVLGGLAAVLLRRRGA